MGLPIYRQWLAGADCCRQKNGRPLVGLCYAQSLDGCLAETRGCPTALSGPESGRLTHRLRSLHDAILVGVGTVLSDNPRLTVRGMRGPSPQPVILDSRLRTPPDAYLVTQHPHPAWIAALSTEIDTQASSNPLLAQLSNLNDLGHQNRPSNLRIIPLPASPEGVDLVALLEALAESGISSLMVEGGARVLTSFLAQGLVDWVSITIAPRFIGGLHAVESPLAHLPPLSEFHTRRLGQDVILWGKLSGKL